MKKKSIPSASGVRGQLPTWLRPWRSFSFNQLISPILKVSTDIQYSKTRPRFSTMQISITTPSHSEYPKNSNDVQSLCHILFSIRFNIPIEFPYLILLSCSHSVVLRWMNVKLFSCR